MANTNPSLPAGTPPRGRKDAHRPLQARYDMKPPSGGANTDTPPMNDERRTYENQGTAQPPSPNYRDTLLRVYDVANRKADNLDTISARVKTWCVTLWGVFVANLLIKAPSSNALFILAIFAILTMWAIDLHYKFFQEQMLALIRTTERMLLQDEITMHDVAAVSFGSNITGRIYNEAGFHQAFLASIGKYWFHFLYLALVAFTLIIRLFPRAVNL